jgi:hypothetical protein
LQTIMETSYTHRVTGHRNDWCALLTNMRFHIHANDCHACAIASLVSRPRPKTSSEAVKSRSASQLSHALGSCQRYRCYKIAHLHRRSPRRMAGSRWTTRLSAARLRQRTTAHHARRGRASRQRTRALRNTVRVCCEKCSLHEERVLASMRSLCLAPADSHPRRARRASAHRHSCC